MFSLLTETMVPPPVLLYPLIYFSHCTQRSFKMQCPLTNVYFSPKGEKFCCLNKYCWYWKMKTTYPFYRQGNGSPKVKWFGQVAGVPLWLLFSHLSLQPTLYVWTRGNNISTCWDHTWGLDSSNTVLRLWHSSYRVRAGICLPSRISLAIPPPGDFGSKETCLSFILSICQKPGFYLEDTKRNKHSFLSPFLLLYYPKRVWCRLGLSFRDADNTTGIGGHGSWSLATGKHVEAKHSLASPFSDKSKC